MWFSVGSMYRAMKLGLGQGVLFLKEFCVYRGVFQLRFVRFVRYFGNFPFCTIFSFNWIQ